MPNRYRACRSSNCLKAAWSPRPIWSSSSVSSGTVLRILLRGGGGLFREGKLFEDWVISLDHRLDLLRLGPDELDAAMEEGGELLGRMFGRGIGSGDQGA